jgi:phthiocerol/phenolphthiocerol synthesis type-I polyketide synthase A
VPVVSTLVVSGKSPGRVASLAAVLAEWMDADGAQVALADVAHTLNHHRSRYRHFATVAARDRAGAVAGLAALAAGQSAPGVVGVCAEPRGPGTVFVYSGQGSQWAGMGRQLLADEPAFAAAVEELEPVFVAEVGFSLRGVLESGAPIAGDAQVQPVIMGLQLALTQLWGAYGVVPDAVIGHSMGEVTAAVVAGALSAADGLRVIATRSKLMARLAGQGAVALLELDAAAAEELVGGYAGVSVAGHVSPRQTVVAGPTDGVDAVIAAVGRQNRFARRVNMEVASHTALMDPILPELRAALADLAPEVPAVAFVSTVDETAALSDGAVLFDADYWVANLRNPARLSQAIGLAAQHHATFIEISAHPILTHAIAETLESTHHHSIGTLCRDGDDTLGFHTNLNSTHTTAPPSTPHPPEPHPVLPATPWHHTHHWLTVEHGIKAAEAASRPGTVLGAPIAVATTPPAHLWQARLLPETKPYPGFHRIQGVEVVPASVLLQTLSTAAAERDAPMLSDVRFERPLVVDEPRMIQVLLDGENITVSSTPAEATPEHRWVKHVSAHTGPRPQHDHDPAGGGRHDNSGPGAAPAAPVAELPTTWGSEGQPFRWSIRSHRSAPGALHADVTLADTSAVALLDAAVHVARLVDGPHRKPLFPAAVDSIRYQAELTDDHGSIEVHRRGGDAEELIVDVDIQAPDGTTCIDIRSLRYAAVGSAGSVPAPSGDSPSTLAHVIDWQPWHEHADPPRAPETPGPVAVVGDGDGARVLADRLASLGYRPADVADAECVLYVAEPDNGAAETDANCAARLSKDVAELVCRLAQRDDNPPTFWIVTRGVREAASDAAVRQSCLWGLAGVIRAEQPQLWGGLVDIPAGGAEKDTENMADSVAALSTVLGTPARSILALRDGEFFTPTLAPVSGEQVREPFRCRPDAAYLITGGMGALGLLMAAWLADRGARRLVLAGRTSMPPRRDWNSPADDDVRHKVAAIQALEGRGVSVDTVGLDVGSREAVQALLDGRDEAGLPAIRGVIHAAGVTEAQLLTEMDDNRLQRTLWPKISGAQALHEAFPPGSIDFFFLTAAAGAVFGVPGQGAYAAANAYLDGLARARHRQGCHTVSLDWVTWQGLGFATDAQVAVQELERVGSRPITPDEAFTGWEQVDRYDVGQAVMAPLPSAEATTSETDGATPAKAWSQMSAEEILTKLESGLRGILSRELRMPEGELELNRPFAELGLNSVMAMSVRRQTEQFVGMELSATMLFNHPTVASFAAHLAKKLLPQEDLDGIDHLPDSAGSVLNELFDSVESAPAGSESRP